MLGATRSKTPQELLELFCVRRSGPAFAFRGNVPFGQGTRSSDSKADRALVIKERRVFGLNQVLPHSPLLRRREQSRYARTGIAGLLPAVRKPCAKAEDFRRLPSGSPGLELRPDMLLGRNGRKQKVRGDKDGTGLEVGREIVTR